MDKTKEKDMGKDILTGAGFGTKAVHAGNVHDEQYGSLTMPIYLLHL